MGLLERAESLAAVSRLLARARARTGSSLFIRAGAGLGKSSLLSEAQRMAVQEFRIGASRGDAMETWFPFGLVNAALEQLGGPELVGARSDLPAGADARAARFISVLRWLQADSPQPVLVILDDLHWADADSLALMSFLARRLADQPVALLGSLRPWPSDADEVASALAKSGHAT
ncbi:MAG: ATP-binding protein, partial [Acidimicrobiaceae bacterium]|nr:ATP-binding protein [Acidimicrobiaceae bacterium]